MKRIEVLEIAHGLRTGLSREEAAQRLERLVAYAEADTPPAPIDPTEYRLAIEAEAAKLGRDIGGHLQDWLIPLADAIPVENRWAFFAPFLTGPVRIMHAMCGAETSARVWQTIQDVIIARTTERAGRRH